MSKTVWTFGLLAGGILSAMMLITMPFVDSIGYDKGAATAKQAYKENRPILDVARETTGLSDEELKRYLDPLTLTKGGITAGGPTSGGG